MNKQQYAYYQAAVERNLKGIEHVSTGGCSKCNECTESLDLTCTHCNGDGIDPTFEGEDTSEAPHCPQCQGEGMREPTEREIESMSDLGFSWGFCDSCGSHLGGSRYAAHGVMEDGHLLHLSVCEDCLCYLNYGQLDDMTMREMDEDYKP
jgi:hypothetical protein